MTYLPTEADAPFHRMGGEAGVRAITARFYELVEAEEPELARIHPQGADGRISAGARERFATFLVEWTGGPQIYSPEHGGPMLRRRHADLPVDLAMKNAWMRCMMQALEEAGVAAEVREVLAARFDEIGENLRNIKE